jgi:hypothetical protein
MVACILQFVRFKVPEVVNIKIYAYLLLGCDPEDGGSTLLQQIGKLLPDYPASQLIKQSSYSAVIK